MCVSILEHVYVPEPDVTHTQKRALYSPEGSDVALLDPVAQRFDTLDGEGAMSKVVDTTEHVTSQAATWLRQAVRICDGARCPTLA